MLCNAHIDVCIDMYIYIYSYILLFQPHCGEEYPHEDIHMGHAHTPTISVLVSSGWDQLITKLFFFPADILQVGRYIYIYLYICIYMYYIHIYILPWFRG